MTGIIMKNYYKILKYYKLIKSFLAQNFYQQFDILQFLLSLKKQSEQTKPEKAN